MKIENSLNAVTVEQVCQAVAKLKPVTRATLYRNFQALGIKPLGVRQIPQLYPPDTAQRILRRYGLPAK